MNKSRLYTVSVDPKTGKIYLTDLRTATSPVNLGWHILGRYEALPDAERAKRYWERSHRKLTIVLESLTVFE